MKARLFGVNEKAKNKYAAIAQLVEHQTSTLDVAGSRPVGRSILLRDASSCYKPRFWLMKRWEASDAC